MDIHVVHCGDVLDFFIMEKYTDNKGGTNYDCKEILL